MAIFELAKSTAIKILSVDAKDLFIANHYKDETLNEIGYNIRYANGNINYKKFINSFDDSLETPKVREFFDQVYHGTGQKNSSIVFSTRVNGKEYSQRIINVTFKYSNKEYNKYSYGFTKTDFGSKQEVYVKFGYRIDDIQLKDCVDIRNGELIAIQTNTMVVSPIDDDLLNKYFYFENGVYNAKVNISPLHTVKDLRADLYKNGFKCDGIKYVRYKRSAGSSRKGKCLFIDEKLYDKIHEWENCGLEIKNGQDIDLAGYESYISLPLSSTIGSIEIQPNNILLIDDYESVFNDEAIVVSVGNDNKLFAERKQTTIKNSIWDGESLLDKSMFTEKYEQYGFLLLRNRFFKSACFNTNLQQWFKDNNITDISQLKGRTLAKSIEEIKMITTPSSIKYIKFGSFEQWLNNIEPVFGVVKHEKPTHFCSGRLVQTHYQLLNTLQLNEKETAELVKPSLDYLNALQTDVDVLRYHIHFADETELEDKPLLTKNDIVYSLLGINDKFTDTKLYRNFRYELCKSFKNNLRHGHLLVNGNYSVLFGNGIEMLKSAIGNFNGTSELGIGNIHSTRFEYNKTLLGSRSPHVCASNVLLCTNVESKDIDTYFNFTDGIVSVNAIGECIMDRLSGCDYDSDTMMLTDNEVLIKAAKKNYHLFKPCVNQVSSIKKKRKYTCEEQTDLDVKTSVNKIGECINLSQCLNSIFWENFNKGCSYDELEELYFDIAKLNVLSGIAIDLAKKEFVIDCAKEIKDIKEKYLRYDKKGRKIKPNFIGVIAKSKGYYDNKKNGYIRHKTTMDYLQKCINSFKSVRNDSNYYPFVKLFNRDLYDVHRVKRSQAYRILDRVRETRKQIQSIWQDDNLENNSIKHEMTNDVMEETVNYLQSIQISYHTMYWLIEKIERNEYSDISGTLFNILFNTANEGFYNALRKSSSPIKMLEIDEDGSIDYYGVKFSKVVINNDYQSENKTLTA